MSETNDRTVESYNAHIQEYIDGTPHEVSGVVKDWLDGSRADVPKDARIWKITESDNDLLKWLVLVPIALCLIFMS